MRTCMQYIERQSSKVWNTEWFCMWQYFFMLFWVEILILQWSKILYLNKKGQTVPINSKTRIPVFFSPTILEAIISKVLKIHIFPSIFHFAAITKLVRNTVLGSNFRNILGCINVAKLHIPTKLHLVCRYVAHPECEPFDADFRSLWSGFQWMNFPLFHNY